MLIQNPSYYPSFGHSTSVTYDFTSLLNSTKIPAPAKELVSATLKLLQKMEEDIASGAAEYLTDEQRHADFSQLAQYAQEMRKMSRVEVKDYPTREQLNNFLVSQVR